MIHGHVFWCLSQHCYCFFFDTLILCKSYQRYKENHPWFFFTHHTVLRKLQGELVLGKSTIFRHIPAGNLFTSAAILYSGAFPAKFLRALSIMKCATITSNTFFHHQRDILQPVLNITWEKHQLSLFSMIKAEGQSLILAGDGRADSPGHCAKYGSYTVIDMTCSKVFDFKLVQVNFKVDLCCCCCCCNKNIYN